MFTDERSAAALDALPGLEIDGSRVEALDEALELAVDGVSGVNLSGMAAARGVETAAEIQATGSRRRTTIGVGERLTGMWKAKFALEDDTVLQAAADLRAASSHTGALPAVTSTRPAAEAALEGSYG